MVADTIIYTHNAQNCSLCVNPFIKHACILVVRVVHGNARVLLQYRGGDFAHQSLQMIRPDNCPAPDILWAGVGVIVTKVGPSVTRSVRWLSVRAPISLLSLLVLPLPARGHYYYG
jgi:hypothetical protein